MFISHWQNTFHKLSKTLSFTRRQRWPNIVTKSDLKQLRHLAMQASPTQLDVNMEAHQRMLGDALSPYAKTGFEFAETRLYQQGDNVKFINWRRFANTKQLYVNTFHEERRPQHWLILDRQASMRFGTKVRLKVSQAARLALYNLFKAQQQQFEIGVAILDEHCHWYEAKSANADFSGLIEHICSACPPLIYKKDNLLNQSLRILKARLQPGCLITVISDFIALNKSDLNILSSLSNQHSVFAVHIVDPVEKTLPSNGRYYITNPHDDSVVSLDCDQTVRREQLQQRMQQKLANTEQQLTQHQIGYQQISSHEELIT